MGSSNKQLVKEEKSPNGWMTKGGKVGHDERPANEADVMEVGMVGGLGAD